MSNKKLIREALEDVLCHRYRQTEIDYIKAREMAKNEVKKLLKNAD